MNFDLLDRLDVEPAIVIRNNASTRERGCQLRREEVLLLKKLGYQKWKQIKDAGRPQNTFITILISNRIHETISSNDSYKVGLKVVNRSATFAAN
jgi:hypothetical protein